MQVRAICSGSAPALAHTRCTTWLNAARVSSSPRRMMLLPEPSLVASTRVSSPTATAVLVPPPSMPKYSAMNSRLYHTLPLFRARAVHYRVISIHALGERSNDFAFPARPVRRLGYGGTRICATTAARCPHQSGRQRRDYHRRAAVLGH